jgi:hypothetical protein
MLEKHSLTFPTEIGSLKIEIETDLDLFKEQKLMATDHFYLQKVKEIKEELLRLSEEKKWNDLIWKKIRFKVYIGIEIYLYQKENDFMISIVSPEEWNYTYMCEGHFVLNINNVWEKKREEYISDNRSRKG